MLARILRIGAGLEVIAAALLAYALMQLGMSAIPAVLLALLLPLAVHAVPLAIEFVTGAVIDRRPVARLGPFALTRVWLDETGRSFQVFNIDQPWRADFAEPAHRARLRKAGGALHPRLHVQPRDVAPLADRARSGAALELRHRQPRAGLAPVDRYPESVHAAVERLRRATGAERVTLVCHSMGGLVARAYLRAHGHHAVARVVTIDTPHHGTLFARFGKGTTRARCGLRASSCVASQKATNPSSSSASPASTTT